MEKKPKLLDKRRLIISCKSNINAKILEQALKSVNDFESIIENDMVKFLAQIFMLEPKVLIIAHNKVQDNIEYARHVRNNPTFIDIPIICISEPLKKENLLINKKIANLNLKYFYTPFNAFEVTKLVKEYLDN